MHGYAVDPRQLGPTIANYFAVGVSGQARPDSLAPGFFTDQSVRRLQAIGQRSGVPHQFGATAIPYLRAYRAANGQVVVFTGFDQTDRSAPPNGCLLQNQSRTNWDATLPPGPYGSITSSARELVVAIDPPKGHGRPGLVAAAAGATAVDWSVCIGGYALSP
jgi:hypothetical protein